MREESLREGVGEAQREYLGAMRRRFASASHGDGTWADLAPSTKLKRYYEAGNRFKRTKGVTHADRLRFVAAIPFPILYITGAGYSSLVEGQSDNLFQVMSDRVRAGSTVFHFPYHQRGGGRLPRRSILIDPDAAIMQQMTAPLGQGFRRFLTQNV